MESDRNAVPPITVATSGSTLANLLINTHPTYALNIVLSSYVQLGCGLVSWPFLDLHQVAERGIDIGIMSIGVILAATHSASPTWRRSHRLQ